MRCSDLVSVGGRSHRRSKQGIVRTHCPPRLRMCASSHTSVCFVRDVDRNDQRLCGILGYLVNAKQFNLHAMSWGIHREARPVRQTPFAMIYRQVCLFCSVRVHVDHLGLAELAAAFSVASYPLRLSQYPVWSPSFTLYLSRQRPV